ncbi:MAG: LysM peptidoglycan-binding domain-containing protein [Dehalococcoidia bacterium]|nr:LysM peptidoglycan-binding domain-containing protein [Dehalococcoidia bacterium]
MDGTTIAFLAATLAVASSASLLAATCSRARWLGAGLVLVALLPAVGTLALFGRVVMTEDAGTQPPSLVSGASGGAAPGGRSGVVTTPTATRASRPPATPLPTRTATAESAATATPDPTATPPPAAPVPTVEPVPSTAAGAPSPPPEGVKIYVVKRGDWMSAIADRLDVPLRALLQANDIPEPTRVEVGHVLRVP